jgi:hypothetical protein
MNRWLYLIVGDGKYGNHRFLGPLKDEPCGALVRCQFSPGTGPLVFGQDGPLAEMAQRQLLRIKQMTDTAC